MQQPRFLRIPIKEARTNLVYVSIDLRSFAQCLSPMDIPQMQFPGPRRYAPSTVMLALVKFTNIRGGTNVGADRASGDGLIHEAKNLVELGKQVDV